jgi:type I restriction enzyme R subunit
VDAVGVCESDKTDSRPLDRQPTVPLKALLQRVLFPAGKRDEDTLTTLAARSPGSTANLNLPSASKSAPPLAGKRLPPSATLLLRLRSRRHRRARHGQTPAPRCKRSPPRNSRPPASSSLRQACAPFDKPALRDTLETQKETEQALDIYTPDEVLSQGFDAAAKAKAAGLGPRIPRLPRATPAEITALQILYSRPFKQRLTEPMLKELEKKLRDQHAAWTEDRLWDAFAVTAPGQGQRPLAGRTLCRPRRPRPLRPGTTARARALRRFRVRAVRRMAHGQGQGRAQFSHPSNSPGSN